MLYIWAGYYLFLVRLYYFFWSFQTIEFCSGLSDRVNRVVAEEQ